MSSVATGGTQTVVNAIGELVRAGKRVLVVSPRRSTTDGISHRLTRVGLPGLAVTPRLLRRNLGADDKKFPLDRFQYLVDRLVFNLASGHAQMCPAFIQTAEKLHP